MTPHQIRKSITKLASDLNRTESDKYDHGLHASLAKLHGAHGTRKLLTHLHKVVDESGESPEYDVAQDVGKTLGHLKQAAGPEAAESSPRESPPDQAAGLRRLFGKEQGYHETPASIRSARPVR